MVVDVHFLGKPKVLIDGIPIEMEQKKAQAMLLYVLFNGSATRDELAELLWCDYPAEKAKSNLRNVLYKLKTLVGDDILTAKGHSFIKVAEDVKVRRDIDLFITEDSQDQIFSLDSYVFLEHFYVKNCPEFEAWISSMRTVYEKLLVKRLTKELHSGMASRADHRTERCAARILTIDPYHEEACRALMHVYMMRGDYSGATTCYQKLKRRLAEDLGVSPAAETEEMFRQLLEMKKAGQTAGSAPEGVRNQTIVRTLEQEYRKFTQNQSFNHCVLTGDIGMGKSMTLQTVMKTVDEKRCVHLKFHMAHRDVPYYGVEQLLEALNVWSGEKGVTRIPEGKDSVSTLYYFKQLEAFGRYLKKTGQKLLLVIQNLEAIDRASIDIFLAALFETRPECLLIFGEYCMNFADEFRLPEKLATSPYCRILELPLLDERDSVAYLREQLDRGFDHDEILKEGYVCSGGNLLLLREYARNVNDGNRKPYTLSEEGREMVDKLLTNLSPDESQLLELLAVLGIAEVEALTQIMQIPSIMVIRSLDSLSRRGWLLEVEEGPHLLLQGRFRIVQDFVCEQMPRYKRTELHRLATEYYESKHKKSPKDPFYLTQLRRHCRYIGAPGKEIYYNILYLEYTLDYFDEFFPTIVDDRIQHPERWIISRQDAFRLLEQYNEHLQAMEDELPAASYCELRMKLDYLKGRAMIRSGQREEAMIYIRKLIDMADNLGRNDILIKAYVEAICYTLRAENTQLMREYLLKAHAVKGFEKYEKERGVILRLEGYLAILNGQHDRAQKLLEQSVALFEQPKLRSTNYYNIAGAYDYMALNCRRQGRLDEALVYIHKSIDLCLEKNVQKSLDLFYEDCGYILFLKGDYNAAEQYFQESIELYEQFDTFWLRSISESGLAMIYASRDQRDMALEHFRRAEVFSRKEQANEELKCLDEARRTLKKRGIL